MSQWRIIDLTRTPLAYPGTTVTRPLLLLPSGVHPVTLSRGEGLERLDDDLRRRAVAPLAARTPVVAVGSNGDADVLRVKLTRGGAVPVVPLVPARLAGVAVAHSAHVARAGFVPAAPTPRPGNCDVVVGFLDDDQLHVLDATEPNYVRRRVDGPRYRLTLHHGQELPGVQLYDSRWGVLGERGRPLLLRSQPALFAWLAAQGLAPWVGRDAAGAARVLAADAGLRDRLREQFVDRGLVVRPQPSPGSPWSP